MRTRNVSLRVSISDFVDRVLMIIKWPVAIASVAMLPVATMYCWRCFTELLGTGNLFPFVAGISSFIALFKLFKNSIYWHWLRVLEHELVHLVFVIICLKRPSGLQVLSDSGYVSYDRGGNWLITISPYVFPLIPITAIAATKLSAVGSVSSWTFPAIMGFALAAHAAITWWESEFRQPDIQKVGPLFAVMICPSLHATVVAAAMAACASDSHIADPWQFDKWSLPQSIPSVIEPEVPQQASGDEPSSYTETTRRYAVESSHASETEPSVISHAVRFERVRGPKRLFNSDVRTP